MANLIITVIAIALVAVAALMGAYYGGSAFITSQTVAKGSTVLNQAMQVAGAWNAYLGDNANTPPTSLSALTTSTNNVAGGVYLREVPVAPDASGGVAAFPMFVATATVSVGGGAARTHYFAYADVGRPGTGMTAGASDPNAGACLRIQKAAVSNTAPTLTTAAQGAIVSAGNNTFGCAILSGAITNGFGGAAVPSGDLQSGDYVLEYLLN